MKFCVNIILTILFITFLVLFFGKHPLAWPGGDALVLPGPPKQDYREIKKRMRFHGTLAVEMDMNGQWWFYREGMKCRLK